MFRQYPKKDLGKHPVLEATEFDSHEELEQIMDSSHALKMQVRLTGTAQHLCKIYQLFIQDPVR